MLQMHSVKITIKRDICMANNNNNLTVLNDSTGFFFCIKNTVISP